MKRVQRGERGTVMMDGGVHDGIRRPVQIVTGVGANWETSATVWCG